jgi:hypothetical protein
MPSFDAEAVVDPMRFRFKPGDEYRVIPEPSTLQVQAFVNGLITEGDLLRKELANLPEDEPLEDTLKRLGPEQVEATVKRNAEIYSALCSGIPAAEELEKLPHRVFSAWAEWVRGELGPEVVSGAGRTPGQTRPSAAAA